jgi:superfamily II DNA or RNA helicase
MDGIEILNAPPPGPLGAPHKSTEDPLAELLRTSKGYPKVCTDLHQMLDDPKCLWTLNGPKIPAEVRVLGAVYWVSKDVLVKAVKDPVAVKNLKDFASVLALTPVVMLGQWAPHIKAFYVNGKRSDVIGVPRFWGLSMFGQPVQDIRTLGLSLTMKAPDLGLRPMQVQAVGQALSTLEEWGGATITADCGFGKTRLAVDLVSKLGRRALILCNREVLMDQWANVIQELVPGWTVAWMQGAPSLCKASIGKFVGPSRPHDICVASIDTLVDADVPKSILQNYGTVIVDEAHHLAAATLVHALPMVASRYVVGLSATPDRRDGLEHALYWLAGPSAFVYKRLPSITGIHGSVLIKQIMANGCSNREKMYANGQLAFAEMLTALSEDPRRQKYIVDLLVESLPVRRKIIVVSGMVQHCKDLMDLLSSTSSVSMALMAGHSPEVAKAKANDTRVVFATYSMLEEGYDDPTLDTLILATPRSRIQQTIGRIERTHEGKLVPVVFDIVDPFSVYPSMWYKRRHFYKSRGFQIETDV